VLPFRREFPVVLKIDSEKLMDWVFGQMGRIIEIAEEGFLES
jgi:hypothetical protein